MFFEVHHVGEGDAAVFVAVADDWAPALVLAQYRADVTGGAFQDLRHLVVGEFCLHEYVLR